MSWDPRSGKVPPSARPSLVEEWFVALAVCVILFVIAIVGLFAIGAL